MSFRHHIDDFMRGRIIGKIEEGRKITDVARSSTSLTALFHGCESHLKLLECVVDGTGEVVLEVRRLQKTDISSYQQKEQAHHSSAGGKSVSCCRRKADLPKNCWQTFEGRRTIRTHTCCVCPVDQTAPYCRLQWCREHHN
ncbi:hypothetical protein TNCV_2467781 [Trichonephila clavipes]|nr:hypothetical protein TNCV_2467781 [Trichonephila clavipes]